MKRDLCRTSIPVLILLLAVIPKSVTPHRIEENAIIVDLTEEDIKALFELEKENHTRFCKPYWTGWGNIGFPDLD